MAITALIGAADVAAGLGVSVKTLAMWRQHGGGPPYVRVGPREGSRVRYDPAAVNAWIKSRTYTCTYDEQS